MGRLCIGPICLDDARIDRARRFLAGCLKVQVLVDQKASNLFGAAVAFFDRPRNAPRPFHQLQIRVTALEISLCRTTVPGFPPTSPDDRIDTGDQEMVNLFGAQDARSKKAVQGSYSRGEMAQSPDSYHDLRACELRFNGPEHCASPGTTMVLLAVVRLGAGTAAACLDCVQESKTQTERLTQRWCLWGGAL